MKTKILIGLSLVCVVISIAIIGWYASISNPPAPLRVSHSPLSTPAETSSVTPSPVATTSQPATPNPVPAPTVIPGARSTDWKTYRNYEWQFEMQIPPNWTAEQVGPGLVISGDSAAIRIDTEGVGPDEGATSAPAIATKMIAGQQVQVADNTFFSLKRNGYIPYYFFRVNNWTNTVDKILSTFKSW